MKKLWIILTALQLSMVVSAQNKTTTPLSFSITRFEDNNGQLIVQLFHKEDKVPTQPFKQIKAVIRNNKAEVSINDIPYGEYAAIFVHDKNSNGKIDHRFGIPNEPIGFTNNWKLSLLSGMPTFEKLKFVFNGTHNSYNIKMSD